MLWQTWMNIEKQNYNIILIITIVTTGQSLTVNNTNLEASTDCLKMHSCAVSIRIIIIEFMESRRIELYRWQFALECLNKYLMNVSIPGWCRCSDHAASLGISGVGTSCVHKVCNRT